MHSLVKKNMFIIETISILIFVALFIKFPELDLLSICKRYNITNTSFGFILVVLALFGIWIHKYSNIISVIIFIIFFIIFKTRFTFIELFTDLPSNENQTDMITSSTTTSTIPQNKLLTAQEIETAKAFLIKQTESDPNKTPLEKTVIDDIINTYFSKSNKLQELKDFNVATLVKNPLPGDASII